jgi:hypothetical protein
LLELCCPGSLNLQAAEAAAASGGSGVPPEEHEAVAARCRELEKKFAVARKKIQVGAGSYAC